MRFVVKRYWEVCDSVEVEADSAEEAITTAHQLPINPVQAEYVPDSINSDPELDVQPLPPRPLRLYEGRREGYVVVVTVDGKRLPPRWDLYNHSPTGFEWGYGGSGPAQLAIAILADHCANDEQAFIFHQRFKWAIVAVLPKRGWKLSDIEIERALARLRAEEFPLRRAS